VFISSSTSFSCSVKEQWEFTESLKKINASKNEIKRQIQIIIIFLDKSQVMLLVRNSETIFNGIEALYEKIMSTINLI